MRCRILALTIACGIGLASVCTPAAAQYRTQDQTDLSASRDRAVSPQDGATNQSRIGQPTDFDNTTTTGSATDDRYSPDQIEVQQQPDTDTQPVQSERRRQFPPQPPSEFERYVSELIDRDITTLGSELFLPDAPTFTGSPTTAIPLDYRISPGDELIVGLTGSVEAANLRLVVDQDGRIFIPRVGAVRVGGVPYGDLQSTLADQVGRQYRDFRVSATIGTMRGINVHVTGFARMPGTYTISSLSTLVNGVIAAGGPAPGGSMRSIQLRRSGQLIADLDFYAFLQRGDTSQDVALQDGDVITFAPAGPQFAVIGSVNREGIYEARASDKLYDALLYAGGANTIADLSRLHILNPAGTEGWQEVAPEALTSMDLQRGMVLRVLSAVGIAQPTQRLQSLVTISGEVERPGRYFVPSGTTLAQVIELAGGFTPQAFTYGAVFIRDRLRREQQENYDRAVNEVRINLLADPLSSADGRERDLGSHISAISELFDRLRDRQFAGRVALSNGDINAPLNVGFVVDNNDSIYIPPRPLTVGVYGMVNNQSEFVYQEGVSIRDYIRNAGNFNPYADRSEVFVIRANGTVSGGRGVLSQRAYPGDVIFVPIHSNRGELWSVVRNALVNLLPGAVTTAIVVSATN